MLSIGGEGVHETNEPDGRSATDNVALYEGWPHYNRDAPNTAPAVEQSLLPYLTAPGFHVPYNNVSPGSVMNINEMTGWQLTTLEHAKLISGIMHARTARTHAQSAV